MLQKNGRAVIKPHLFLHITQQQNHLQSLINEEKQTTKVKEKQQKMQNIFKWKHLQQEHIQKFTPKTANSTNKKVRTNQQKQLFIISKKKKITKN